MTILITAEGEFVTAEGDAPEVGKKYSLDKPETQTDSQRKAWHALVQEWFKTGCHSYDVKDLETFREYVKRDYGAGFESYVFADITASIRLYSAIDELCKQYSIPEPEKLFGRVTEAILKEAMLKEVDTVKEIPPEILQNKKCIRGKLKSFTRYTKKDVMDSLDRLISAMDASGVQTKKYYEILKGMEDGNKQNHSRN